jgi:hypothetical protein
VHQPWHLVRTPPRKCLASPPLARKVVLCVAPRGSSAPIKLNPFRSGAASGAAWSGRPSTARRPARRTARTNRTSPRIPRAALTAAA